LAFNMIQTLVNSYSMWICLLERGKQLMTNESFMQQNVNLNLM